jgi:hypothetical protein
MLCRTSQRRGIAFGSPVAFDYCKNVPIRFIGTIERVHVKYVAAT